MLCSAVRDVLEQKLDWFESLENAFRFPYFIFCFSVLYVHCKYWKILLLWVKVPNCKAIYCSNTTGKALGKIWYFQFPNPRPERKLEEILYGLTILVLGLM